MSTKTQRPHKDRILSDLNDIRKELIDTVNQLSPDELDREFPHGIKNYRAILQEIGAMEAITVGVLKGESDDWEAAVAKAGCKGPDAASVVADLSKLREETVAYLEAATEDQMETPFDLPQSWHGYFNAPHVEPEELFRWIVRHEYYHLGQMITMRWMDGHNPYK